MKMSLRKSLIIFVLFASFVMASSSVFAAVEKPYFSFISSPQGTWSYDASTYALTLNFPTIGTSFYKDGTFSSTDTIKGGTIMIDNGVIYNGGADSMVVGSQAGGTGSMNFTMFEGTTNYINATMTSFVVTKDGFGTRLNPGFDAFHIENITTNSGVSSKFLTDVDSLAVPVGNLNFTFTCSTGDCGNNNFTADASGTITAGKLSIVPEPVSSILFMTGGATLVYRRYRSKRK